MLTWACAFVEYGAMYLNESQRQYTLPALLNELTYRKRIPGALRDDVEDLVRQAQQLAPGDSMDICSAVRHEPESEERIYMTIWRVSSEAYRVMTYYVELNNHVRGPCLGVYGWDIEPGKEFMALGGNSGISSSRNHFAQRRISRGFARILR